MLARLRFLAWIPALLCVWTIPAKASVDEEELLVSDRLSNRVLRYTTSGAFAGVLVDDPVNLDEPNGMALSPDGDNLYVASRQNSSVVRYDYDGHTATNPTVLISAGLNVPASMLFETDNSKLYVSNLGLAFDAATVGQFNPDGTSAGADLTGGLPTGRSGLAFSPDGDLLVSGFLSGEIMRYNEATSSFETFIGPNDLLQGAGNIVVYDDSLFVAAGFTGMVMKFDATTGEPDPEFVTISGLQFPASLAIAPGGNGLLVGSLGFADGTGRIDRYHLGNGSFVELFAENSNSDPSLGFREATGMLVVDVPTVEGQDGDTDDDGDVDLDDLNATRNHFGEAGADDGSLDGDAFPFDGVVDLDDLNGVRNNFGAGPGSPGAVPEPSSVLLALAGLAACGVAVRRHRAA